MVNSDIKKLVTYLVWHMKYLQKRYFYLGILIFFLLIFFAPVRGVYFLSYFVSIIFFYLATKNLRFSFLFSLILSLFSDIGLGGSLFLMEPAGLDLGSGWWFTPMSLLILCIIPLTLQNKIKKFLIADKIIFIFLLWNILLVFLIPNINVLYGVLSLSELIFLYLILRIYLSEDNVEFTGIILIIMLLAQSSIGFIQFILRRPIGILSEALSITNQFGITTPEENNFFRVTGTFTHPNNFAAVLLVLIPFLFFFKFKNDKLKFIVILPLFILFFTYSRAAWIIFGIISVLILINSNFLKNIKEKVFSYKKVLMMLLIIFFGLIFLGPYILKRFESIQFALTQKGSLGVRIKLIQESFNLISEYPITGVGLNLSLATYIVSPITNILEISPKYFYQIHNTFLEIITETGIPGLILFSLFLFFVFKKFFSQKNNSAKKAAFYGLLGLIGISLFNPFLHASQFRLFFLLSAIILI